MLDRLKVALERREREELGSGQSSGQKRTWSQAQMDKAQLAAAATVDAHHDAHLISNDSTLHTLEQDSIDALQTCRKHWQDTTTKRKTNEKQFQGVLECFNLNGQIASVQADIDAVKTLSTMTESNMELGKIRASMNLQCKEFINQMILLLNGNKDATKIPQLIQDLLKKEVDKRPQSISTSYDHDGHTRAYYRAIFKWKSARQMQQLARRLKNASFDTVSLFHTFPKAYKDDIKPITELLERVVDIASNDCIQFNIDSQPENESVARNSYRAKEYLEYRKQIIETDLYNFRLSVIRLVASAPGDDVLSSMLSTLNSLSKQVLPGVKDIAHLEAMYKREDLLVKEMHLLETPCSATQPKTILEFMESYEKHLKGLIRDSIETVRLQLFPTLIPLLTYFPTLDTDGDWYVDSDVWKTHLTLFKEFHKNLNDKVKTNSPAFVWLFSVDEFLRKPVLPPPKFKSVWIAARDLLHSELLLG